MTQKSLYPFWGRHIKLTKTNGDIITATVLVYANEADSDSGVEALYLREDSGAAIYIEKPDIADIEVA